MDRTSHMLSTIEAVTERIVEGFDPDSIILFGSMASEGDKWDSDIDLLIVKETDDDPASRRAAVERLLQDRAVPLDILVYTPGEIRTLFSMGSPFIEEIMESGRLLYMRKATERWLEDAREELESALILEEHGKYRGACYHAQQCAEKALKALLLEKGERPPRTHDIIQLLNKTRELGWKPDLEMEEAIFLNSIYKGRYPAEEGLLPKGEPRLEEARRALDAAKKLFQCLAKLKSPART
jgi:HEPN domain-containing protein/predicted nucleotidyltransferase